MDKKKEAITLENVSFSYDKNGLSILKDVNLEIIEGEFLGVIGPNGGGKTTLLKLIMGFLKPDAGQIKIFGKPIDESESKVAYVPQTSRFDRDFPISVLEVVLSGRLSRLSWYGRYSKADEKAALDKLEQVGLSEYKNVPFGTLSGGQAQRTLIARALVSEPEILLLDEPTASIDTEAEEEICKLLKQLRGSITMLMVTHDLSTFIRDVQRVICVQKEVYSFMPNEVCEHFALGLYHAPLIQMKEEKHYHFKFTKKS